MTLNLKINYLYRDDSNYKQYESVVLTNKQELDINYVKDVLIARLIDGEYFVASEWGFPELFFETTTGDDHNWHEWQGIEYTYEAATHDIMQLLNSQC